MRLNAGSSSTGYVRIYSGADKSVLIRSTVMPMLTDARAGDQRFEVAPVLLGGADVVKDVVRAHAV